MCQYASTVEYLILRSRQLIVVLYSMYMNKRLQTTAPPEMQVISSVPPHVSNQELACWWENSSHRKLKEDACRKILEAAKPTTGRISEA